MVWVEYQPHQIDLTIIYVSVCLGVGALVQCILRNVAIGDVRIPYGSILLTFGILLGVISLTSETLKNTSAFILNFPTFDLVALVFPSFIFKMAFQIDVHIFSKSFTQILTISVFGFTISCLILGCFMAYNTGQEFAMTTAIAFGLLGSVIDTKDTNKFLGQFKNLGVLLAGEELITSSMSLFLYDVLIHFDAPKEADTVSSVLFKTTAAIITGLIVGKLFICLVSWDRCDFATIVTISLFLAYAMFYGVRIYLGASGILTLTVFGIIICCNKGKITTELEISLIEFWQLLYTLFNFVMYIQAGVLLVLASNSHGEADDIVTILMTYIMCIITRSLMLLILSPILSRIGYGLNWKNGAVLVWGALKGTSTMLLAFCVYIHPNNLGVLSSKFMIYGVGLVLLHLVINGTTVKKLVKLLGFTTVSMMKISNMNTILSYVMSARDRSINVLKMNKLYADAAWDTVREATKIIHPYKSSLPQEGEFKEGEEKDLSYSTCPDCKKEIPLVPTAKELQEMKKEAYLRILKAKKVSYWRQFEWGMMSKDAHRTLVATVNDALEKKTGIMDADSLRNMWKPRGYAVFIRNKLVKLIPKKDFRNEYLKFPLRSWQMHLYKVVSSLWWEYGIFLLIILIIISFALDVTYRPKFKGMHEWILISLSTVCFILLFLTTFFKMSAVGCYNYVRSPWHLLDLLTVVLSFFYSFYVYEFYLTKSEKNGTNMILLCLSASRMVYVVRFFRLCLIIQATVPKVIELLDRKIDVHLAQGYDIGKGFVTGEDEVLKLLPRIVVDTNAFAEIKFRLEADRLAMTKEIGILQRNRPTIAITVKTRQAMTSVLHVMRATTKDLKDGGLLDDEEYSLVSKAINERQKYIRKRFLSISPCPPDVLLRQVTWLIDDEETATFLITHSLSVNLNYEEILIRADEEPQGIYVIVSGIARMNYFPNQKKLEKLERFGALPNVDYPNGMDYRERQEDYIVSGNVVGEIGILTGRTHDSNITCESSVQAYFISIDVMKYAIKSQAGNYNGLQQRIWKAVSVRLASVILPAVPTYQSWSQEKIQRYLQRSFVPKLNTSKTFFFGDIIEAVLLIEGRALDTINKDVYFAPSYIPRTVQKLNFASTLPGSEYHVEPILLVVPAEDIDEQDFMDYLEGGSGLTDTRPIIGLQRKLHTAAKRKPEGRIRNKLGLTNIDVYRGGVRAIRAGSAAFEKFQRGLDPSDTDWFRLDKTETKKTKEGENENLSEKENGVSCERRDSDWENEKEDNEDGQEMRLDTDDFDEADEARDGKAESGLYTFSYFNYKPAYKIDSDESGDDAAPTATVHSKNERSENDERKKEQVKKRWWKRKSERNRSPPLVEEEPPSDDNTDYPDPKPGTSKSS